MFDELYEAMLEVEEHSEHDGYLYKVNEVLIVLVMGLFCGLESISRIYEWSKTQTSKDFFKKEFGIERTPQKSQFYYILSCVNPKIFADAFTSWMQKLLYSSLPEETKDITDKTRETVSIDGKSIRSTGKLNENGNILHIASAIIADRNLVIASSECEEKSNEIKVFREIIKSLSLNGEMIVSDAMHCQKESAETVIDAGADYLLIVKNNQANLRKSVEEHIKLRSIQGKPQVELNAGRIETRTAYVCDEIDLLFEKEKWKNIACVGAIHREFEKNGKTTSEWHYYISSDVLTPEALLHHARLHWRVEVMHWLLDVHFREDETKIRDMNVQKVLNIMRKIVLNFARIYQSSLNKKTPLSRILDKNLFDINNLKTFITYFRQL